MTDTIKTSLNHETILRLFKNSVCLTYNPLESMSAFLHVKELEKEFKSKNIRVRSKTAKLPISKYNPDFHFFSDGTLIHRCDAKKDYKKLQKIYQLLRANNLTVINEYAPQTQMDYFTYSEMLRFISEQALINYSYKTDLYVEELPSLDSFIEECFANNSILLTASKNDALPAELREYVAFFDNGKVLVSNDYKVEKNKEKSKKIKNILSKYSQEYILCNIEYISQDLINSIYKKAEEFEWFLPLEDIDKIENINKEVNSFFKNRHCITVTNPDYKRNEMNPDIAKYAVFSDGLVVSSNNGEIIKELKNIFPDKELYFMSVSDLCIKQIYNKLPEFQKSASTIYIEMLKQKARKLKRETGEQHSKMLDFVAKQAGWKNWNSIKIDNEPHARILIDEEKIRNNK
ncbi:MAG: hypothetical protein IKC10_07015 [Alphaproteobacteria bacterium]|nr:hypothetical protein [Alphaproteobacteria bacterium]